jgi:hypothetical protein
MGMRETPRSLRLYFLFVGTGAALAAAGAVSAWLHSTHDVVGGFGVLCLVAYAVEMLNAGIRFRTLLRERPKRLEQAVYTVLGLGLLRALDNISIVGLGGSLVEAMLELLIPLYLLVNVRRLAREAAASPPTA